MKIIPLVLAILAGAALASCSKPTTAQAAASDVDYYTCTMHPSVHLHDPDAKCPICGMELVPVKKVEAQLKAADPGAAAADQPREFSIPIERQQLIGVTYAAAEARQLERTIRAAGTVAATTGNHWDYVARVDGYIHNLNVATPGEAVKKGEVLMDIYSPDLTATENEYIDLLRMRDAGARDNSAVTAQSAEHLLAGARARLSQWNISDDQINALEKEGKAREYLDLTSPVDAVVAEVAVHQGRHVAVGDHLVDLVNLSSVWVWADFYESELPLLKVGQSVMVSSSADPGLSISGKIALMDPFLNGEKRTGRVRIDVQNSEGRLRPDAYVDISLKLDEGRGLTIPADAVLPTGQHNVVFVDKGAGRLEPRFIQVGARYGDNILVTSGLREGERVVSSANFLVDAESKVQGALKSW
ncbi:MAG TPA: efflux RND transporter periplasmic adaptor subunit [Opitutaceae bacterium]|jgi:Cu(I)/Ag(I) efflux system membrane fusion protein|nr:efflux RND transporter periplasmic adaptor subunit [Opitutaceae bacterium]